MSHDHPPIALLCNVWVRRIIGALEHEGFRCTERQGSQLVYRHPDRRLVVNITIGPMIPFLPTSFAISSSAPAGPRSACTGSDSSPNPYTL